LLYGSNAIGGVVNMLDQRIPDYRPTEPLSGTLDVRGGSVADERAAALDINGGGGPWAWHVDASTRATGDYEVPGRASLAEDEEEEQEHEEEIVSGILPNSDIDSSSGAGGVTRFFGDKGFFGVSVRGFDTNYGVPGGEHEEEEGEHGEEGIRIDMQQLRYDLRGAITEPFGTFQGAKFQLGVVDYEHAELEAPGVVGTEFFNDAWEGRVELIQKARGTHTGSFGLQVRSQDLEAIGGEAFIAPTQSENVGIFTFQEVDRGSVRYQVGLRYETQDTTVRERELPDRDFDGLSGSVGIVWQAADSYSLGVSVARSVKMPTGEELYSSGLHFATSSFELGDPTLDEESALGLDVSLRKTEGRLTGAFNLFYNDFSDYIFQAFTGGEVEGFPVLLWSQDDAGFWGAELDLTIALAERAHSSWDLDLLWDMVDAELDSGEHLPRIPPQRYGVGFHYRGDRLRGGAGVRFVDDQDRVADDETPTDGYTMINADVSYRFFFESTYLDVIVKATNLGNEEARSHTSFVKDDVPLPGRNLSLIARFGF
jgi:iron complex outermembrane receptor protein